MRAMDHDMVEDDETILKAEVILTRQTCNSQHTMMCLQRPMLSIYLVRLKLRAMLSSHRRTAIRSSDITCNLYAAVNAEHAPFRPGMIGILSSP